MSTLGEVSMAIRKGGVVGRGSGAVYSREGKEERKKTRGRAAYEIMRSWSHTGFERCAYFLTRNTRHANNSIVGFPFARSISHERAR